MAASAPQGDLRPDLPFGLSDLASRTLGEFGGGSPSDRAGASRAATSENLLCSTEEAQKDTDAGPPRQD